jgi:predicted nucleic acid-binding protein
VLPLAVHHAITSYDAAYLELALRKKAPLATLDAGLARAARAAGVELIGAA